MVQLLLTDLVGIQGAENDTKGEQVVILMESRHVDLFVKESVGVEQSEVQVLCWESSLAHRMAKNWLAHDTYIWRSGADCPHYRFQKSFARLF